MKNISIIFVGLLVSLNLSAQTANDVVKKLQEIREESGDSIARDYLSSNKSVFLNDNDNPTYIVLWGVLTSNMWNAHPSEALKIEYKDYLDSFIDDVIKSDSYTPDQSSLPTLYQISRDYYLILYNDGKKDLSLKTLKSIHRWFKPYPDARNTIEYAQCLLDLCLILVRDLHKNEEGASYVEEYAEVSKNVYGEKSPQYAVALYNMCFIPKKSTKEKFSLLKKAISIYEVAEYQDPAVLKQMRTDCNSFESALTGLTKTDSIFANPNGILSLNDCLSLVVAERGIEALESLLFYKEMMSKQQNLDTLGYSNVITYLINVYLQINELSKAQREIEDYNKKIGIDNVPLDYAQIFYSFAGLVAMRLKDYPKALQYCHAACKLYEQSVGTDIEYCKILGNISTIYALVGESIDEQFYLDAKWYVDEAISVFEDKIGQLTKHGAAGLTLLINKAYIDNALGNRQESIETYEKIVSDFEYNPNIREAWLLAVNNLAVLYTKTDKAEKAVALLETLSSKNREYKQMLAQNLALAYYILGDAKTENALKDYNTICYNNCLDVFNFFTVAEREDFWTRNAQELLVINNLFADKFPEITNVAFDNLLVVKGLKLMSADIIKKLVGNSSDSDLREKYNKVLLLRDAICYRSSEQDSVRIWNKLLNQEERNILSVLPNYKEQLLSTFYTWTEIKHALKEDEIVIDFTYIPKMKDWDNLDGYYGAFIITKESQSPQLVTLCEVDSLNQYFIETYPDAQQISILYNESSPVYRMIWGNLAEYVKDKRTIYFSPTGQLNLLNHNALIMPDGRRLGEIFNLIRLSSTGIILSQTAKKTNGQQYHSAVVYGGVNYDLTEEEMIVAAQKYRHSSDNNQMLANRSENERGHWDYLPGTKEESHNIFNLLKSSNISTTLLQEGMANEESFKALSGHSPSIIHLSTHGFFLNTPEKVKANPFMSKVGNYSEKEDKLIRTGLLLAGANNVWCGENLISGVEDGILTADEISRLDLSETDLVILSACETAKGQVDEIEGVLGLQRGFKKAGAKSIMMSLWKVSDTVTTLFMTEFYTHLTKGMSANEALKAASRTIREQYPNPYYWAAFVLLDGLK